MTDETHTDAEPNEILAAARDAKAHAAAAADTVVAQAARWPLAKIGLAAGIGSAAIAGAVLFANRAGKRK